MESITIKDDFIKLGQALKLAGLAGSGVDAKFMIEEIGVDAVMIGRAAMSNPYLFTQINHFFETGQELPDLPFTKKLDIAEDHLTRLVSLKGEMIAVRKY